MTRLTALAGSLLLFAIGCSSPPTIRSCGADADCGTGNVCVRGSCAGNASPSATFEAPVGATTNRVVTVAATSIDPEGRPVEHRWSVEAVAEGCNPEPEPRSGPDFELVFWCPGTYEVTLVPVDDRGAEGAPVTRSFAVAAATGAPSVSTGAAISAEHRCDAGVTACTVLAPDGSPSLRLAASGADPGGAPLVYEWTAFPPAAAANDPALEVTFAGSPFDAAPTATIANGGGPIAGAYRFRARVRNPDGLLAQAYQEVVVDNHAPILSPAPLTLGHRYDGGLYVAEGDVDLGASDPDGDSIFAEGWLAPTPPTGCTEEVAPAPSGRVHVRIACTLPTGLIGQAARNLTVAIADSNGAGVTSTAPIAVTNRPPSIALGPSFGQGGLAVDHSVEPCGLIGAGTCFVAEAADPFVAVDPDGDPLTGYQLGVTVAADRKASMGTVTADGAAFRFRFETPTSLPSEFRSASEGTGFFVSGSVGDSFGAVTRVVLPLAVRNRAPIVLEAGSAVSVPHRYDEGSRRYLASASAGRFEDPDGDPLAPSVPHATFCSSVTLEEGRATIGCEYAWDYALGGMPPLSPLLAPRSIPVTVSDGWASASSTTTVTILDRPASLEAPMTVVENCACVEWPGGCSRWQASGTGFVVPANLVDPDGDPSQVTASPSGSYEIQPMPSTCLPGWCHPSANVIYPLAVAGTLTAKAGVSIAGATAPFAVTIMCSAANIPCYCPPW